MSSLTGAVFGALFFAGLFIGCVAVIGGGTVIFRKIAKHLAEKFDMGEDVVDLITLVTPLFFTFVMIGALIGATNWEVTE